MTEERGRAGERGLGACREWRSVPPGDLHCGGVRKRGSKDREGGEGGVRDGRERTSGRARVRSV